jgi:hypothetical protein
MRNPENDTIRNPVGSLVRFRVVLIVPVIVKNKPIITAMPLKALIRVILGLSMEASPHN